MSGIIQVNVLIIGSGPAGLTAGLYAARANLQPILLTGLELGGQVSLTTVVENFPGFPNGINGDDLVSAFKEQAERFGTQIMSEVVNKVDFSQSPFRVTTDENDYLANTVIIATGASPRHLQIPGEKQFLGMGVSYCATCDGHFFRGKDVAVVGGGDSAVSSALYLTRHARSVKIIHRRDCLRAGVLLQQAAFNNPKIQFHWDTIVEEIYGDETVEGIHLLQLKTGVKTKQAIDGVFIFAGHLPNTDLFINQLTVDQYGCLTIDPTMQTSIRGIFAAGEVADPRYKQVITSASMGAAAAMQAIGFLEENHCFT